MKTLKAKEGYFLTQSGDVTIQERTITDCLYLPDTADTSVWKEITSAEADELKNHLDVYNQNQNSDAIDNSVSDEIEKKLQDIADYDSSNAVNSFTYQGIVAWLDAETRANYLTSISAAELLGETTITFDIANKAMTISLSDAKIMLAKIQRYADACYLVTMQHKTEVKALTTIADVLAYDITNGYPEKIEL